ncbi:23S rRNA (adenine(2030)-N(6))-methyltransferase RlmJ, partial [Burkholderia sp. Cy-647]|nr:23S rRNA (adenine(2030)-N(6))-methyltransferase RlmJ [Burkholderia sp. Cy-647]
MLRRSRTRFTAWLGLLAMWLIVLAPLVSQLLAAHRADDPTVAAICSTAHAPSQSMAMSMPMPADSAMQMDHTDPLAACGYCDLLADHLVLPSLPPAPLVLIDPSYEDKRDYARTITCVEEGLKRFSTGCYAIWYPQVKR